jgi:hypothetical protein
MADPASLENLTPEQRRDLNLGRLTAQLLTNPETREQAARILQKADSTLQFPDIAAKDEARKAEEKAAAKVAELEKKLLERDAREALARQHQRIKDAGLDVKLVNELMEKHGIPSTDEGYDLVMELLQSRSQLAESTPEILQPMVKPNIKEMWNDPVAWREKVGYEVLNELRAMRNRTT